MVSVFATSLPFLLSSLAFAGGQVDVRTTPSGAGIRVDGEPVAQLTPMQLSLSAGTHRLDAGVGCAQASRTVTVVEGRTQLVELTLKPAMGSVTFLPDPPEMQISIDGALVLKVGVPTDVPCGEHRVKATLPGAPAVVMNLDVGPNQSLSLPISMQVRGVGALAVDVSPETASIELDGRVVGTGDLLLQDIAEGPHQLRAQADGFAPRSANIVLSANQRYDVVLALDPLDGAGKGALADRGPRIARTAGWSALGAGTVLLAVSGVQYLSHRDEWRQYEANGALVEQGELSVAAYDAYYEENLASANRTTLVTGISGGLLAGLGLGLVLVY